MAFCKYCGKKLEDGQPCDCAEAVAEAAVNNEDVVGETQAAEQQQQSSTAQQGQEIAQQSKTIAKNVWNEILGIIKNPADAGAAFVKDSELSSAIILLVIQSVFSGIFAAEFVSKINSGISTLVTALGGWYESDYISLYKFSAGKAFAVTLIFSLILSVVFAALFFAAFKIFKSAAGFEKAVKLVAVRSVAVTLVVIIACVLYLVNVSLGIAAFIISALAGVLFIPSALKAIDDISADKKVYILIAVVIVEIIVFYVVASKGWTLYLPDTIKTALDSFSWTDLLEELY